MLRVKVRGGGVQPTVLGSGETLLVGRAPSGELADSDPEAQLRTTALDLPHVAAHVSRVVAEVVVGEEVVRLRWHGSTEAQLSSLFDAPGGARRVALGTGMSALLDEGENQLLVLRGLADPAGGFSDLTLEIDIAQAGDEEQPAPPARVHDPDSTATAPAPRLERWTKEWFVALALAEPWLTGLDDYPRPPSNREIYERVREWHGYAWNLERPQRVDESIRSVAALAFGAGDNPFTNSAGRFRTSGMPSGCVPLRPVSSLPRTLPRSTPRFRSAPPRNSELSCAAELLRVPLELTPRSGSGPEPRERPHRW